MRNYWKYTPLSSKELEVEDGSESPTGTNSLPPIPQHRRGSVGSSWLSLKSISLLVNFLFCVLLLTKSSLFLNESADARNRFPLNGQLSYTPAESAIDYTLVEFRLGFQTQLEIYEQPPSAEVDEAWDNLTRYSIAQVSRETALKLPNRTWPVSETGLPGHYVIAPNVFHSLHCLNLIRQGLHRDYYHSLPGNAGIKIPGHLDHCLSHIRQSLMCAGDMTPNVYQWSNSHGRAILRTDVPHTCRDFGKLREWVREKWYEEFDDSNLTRYMNDGLGDM
ncbi:hypothetical protein K435DRAFT_970007 [Dendrothele bispora CBS 962.96]|uniref:Uncharacterized protein n=1 Tax=Dendrothele bispora (strain CBS 962.96) TaxID=1314807 RepID=A0A4S8LE12_DENBC|nr:hypothetical protein K435DRAFT_970007 [Dendrothele bispora CBS 962.96]